MSRMLIWTGIGAVVGFVAITGFHVSIGRKDPESAVLSMIGALSLACIAAVFGAVSVVREELTAMRRELMRLQKTEPPSAIQSNPSTQFRAD